MRCHSSEREEEDKRIIPPHRSHEATTENERCEGARNNQPSFWRLERRRSREATIARATIARVDCEEQQRKRQSRGATTTNVATTMATTTSINRRATARRQSRRGSHWRRHDDDNMAMIATIAIGTAMGAELDALNATINKKATAWQWASTESAAMTTLRRVQRALMRRKNWSQTTSSSRATSRAQTTRQGQQQPCPRDGPARQAGEEEATSVAPPCARGTRQRHRER